MSSQAARSSSTPVRPERSALGRLFLFSKDNAAVALENFVTEALAIAVRSAHGPLFAALQQTQPPGLPPRPLPGSNVLVETQVYLAGAFLDLTLAYTDEDGQAVEVWIEVKVDAPESGEQLKAYAKHAYTPGRKCRTHLVVLSKTPLSNAGDAGFVWLPWSTLFTVAHEHGQVNDKWMDLHTFLEEQQVANHSELPITDAEAASLANAHQLITKVASVLSQVNRLVGTTWMQHPSMKWTYDGPLLNQIGNNFRASGKMMTTHGPLFVGMDCAGGNAHWTIAVKPDQTGKKGIANLAQLELPHDWHREPGASVPLSKRIRATACPDRQKAIDWFKDGLAELAATGVVDALMPQGATAVDAEAAAKAAAQGGEGV
jgi:hypothetical protein